VEEQRQIQQRTAPTGKIVHEAIRREGESELERTTASLAWSGLAAGLSMGFSFLGVGLLHAYLPDAPWTPLVSSFGYTLGFLVVVLGRQQLFTENTLTVVLPLMQWRRAAVLNSVLRLWAVVLVANIIGTLVFAFTLARTEVVEQHVLGGWPCTGPPPGHHLPSVPRCAVPPRRAAGAPRRASLGPDLAASASSRDRDTCPVGQRARRPGRNGPGRGARLELRGFAPRRFAAALRTKRTLTLSETHGRRNERRCRLESRHGMGRSARRCTGKGRRVYVRLETFS
jgi:Formate/nitrite transporter